MDSSVWLQRRNVFHLRVCHHISDAVNFGTDFYTHWQGEALVTAWLLHGYCLLTAFFLNFYFLVTTLLMSGYCLVTVWLLPAYYLFTAWLVHIY